MRALGAGGEGRGQAGAGVVVGGEVGDARRGFGARRVRRGRRWGVADFGRRGGLEVFGREVFGREVFGRGVFGIMTGAGGAAARRRGGEAVHEGGEVLAHAVHLRPEGAAAGEEAPEPGGSCDGGDERAHGFRQTDRGMRFAGG